MPRLFDTHAHLDFPKLQDRFTEVLENAATNGVERIVTIGASRGFDSNLRAIDIADAHDHIWCSVGIHPHDAEMATDEIIDRIRDEFARLPKVVAIGETGLDYYYDNAPVEQQKKVFRRFLTIANDVEKPIIIHSRDADEDCIEILKETGTQNGILHCFTGGKAMAEALVKEDLDFYLSFSGIVTFKNGADLLDIAANIVPDDRILVETDSPYLSPVPFRGKTNEPAHVYHTAAKIAEAKGMSLDAFAELTYANAQRVFKLD